MQLGKMDFRNSEHIGSCYSQKMVHKTQRSVGYFQFGNYNLCVQTVAFRETTNEDAPCNLIVSESPVIPPT